MDGDSVSAKLRCGPFSFLVAFTSEPIVSPNFSNFACEDLSFFGDSIFPR